MKFFQDGLFEPACEAFLCEKVVNDEADPACCQKDDDGNDFSSQTNVHFKDFQNSLDAEDDTYDVDDFCYHDKMI